MELLEGAEVERRIERDDLAEWKATRYRSFRDQLTDDEQPFPCYFAVEAQREGWFRYCFAPSPIADRDCADDGAATGESVEDELPRQPARTVDGPVDDALDGLADAFATFLERFESVGEFPSLVVLFEPPASDLPEAAYRRQFWTVLRHLQANDPEPWPASVPTDPADPAWQFCFAGEPVFVVGRAPFYDGRRSRYAPHGLEITVQPWAIFDGLTGRDEAGREAREVIRDRLEAYDDVPVHPDAGDFVDPSKREWKQYLLPKTNEQRVERCPLPERTDVAAGAAAEPHDGSPSPE